MGWSHTFEYVTEEGLSLDLAQSESKCAIEVDGPSHYMKDATSGELIANGATQFKARLLRSYGWQVSHVAFYEWDGRSDFDRRRILSEKLAAMGESETSNTRSPASVTPTPTAEAESTSRQSTSAPATEMAPSAVVVETCVVKVGEAAPSISYRATVPSKAEEESGAW
eukprot:CAMPEP_0198661762 /NCGR_PEP_ID=MMETSP1467-20131203/43841_1 /TAXON_ID=1462469 /ORGANISM="unid. sp., Strain CCMP2135" /LENGTH=167 /DNA_ID=CAMNT_0044398227 /DNA_START=1 /DNA_END=501 /DNA_ORIENTATION=+